MTVLAQREPVIGAPTLICGFPKSGTTLLASLLDGHPDLLCFPEETWALKTASRLSPEECFARVMSSEAIARLGGGVVETPGGVRDYSGFDFERFCAESEARWSASDQTIRAVLESVVAAFAVARGAPPSARWVEKSPEQEIELERHTETWEDLRVVLVVRDPRAVLCSFRRKRERAAQGIFVSGLATRWRRALAAVIHRERRHPGSVTIVRYEDLVTDHRATLGRVVAALGVGWHAALELPSLMGRPWRGNSMYQAEMKGISADSLHRWSDEIDPGERALLEACLVTELSALGYYDVAAESAGFVREAMPVVIGQREGIVARGRDLRRLLWLRWGQPAPVKTAAFARAMGRNGAQNA